MRDQQSPDFPPDGAEPRSEIAPADRPAEDRGVHGHAIMLGFALLWQALGGITHILAGSGDGDGNRPPGPSVRTEGYGRSADRNLAPQRGTAPHRWGTFLSVCAFLVSVAAGVGFLFAYWTGASTPVMGGAFALFLAGLGSCLVIYAHWLIPRDQAVEPREELASAPHERQAVFDEFCAGAHSIQRRGLLKSIAAAGAALAGAIVFSLLRSLGRASGLDLLDTIWKRGQRLMDLNGDAVSLDSLQSGNMIIVFPEGRVGDERAQTLLIRVEENLLQLPRGRTGWAPQGYVAYSRVCTHAGCPVGVYEKTTGLLMCPCHQSTFNVLAAAQPTGGPAARPLPQLPLYADDNGVLRAADGFTEPPGPGFWRLS